MRKECRYCALSQDIFKINSRSKGNIIRLYVSAIKHWGEKIIFNGRELRLNNDSFGGLVVSMLASGTRVRGFKPGIWKKSSACLPSEGKWKNLSHVPALRHVKEPSTSVNYECVSKIPCIIPSFASRGLSCLCGAWRLWRWMWGTHWGKGTIGLQTAVPKKPHKRPLTFLTFSLNNAEWVTRCTISYPNFKLHWNEIW